MGGSTLRGNTTQKVFSLGKGPKPHRILLILRCQSQTVWLQPPFFFVAGHFDHPLRPGSLSLQCWVKAFVSMLGLQGMRKSSAGGCLEQWGHCRWWFMGNDPQMAELVWYRKYGNFPGIKKPSTFSGHIWGIMGTSKSNNMIQVPKQDYQEGFVHQQLGFTTLRSDYGLMVLISYMCRMFSLPWLNQSIGFNRKELIYLYNW